MAASNNSTLWIPITGFVCGAIAIAMVIFMLGETQMYPIWSVIMMGAVAAIAFFYAINNVRARLT